MRRNNGQGRAPLIGMLLLAVAGTAASSARCQTSPAAPFDLRCEYLRNPLGIDVMRPRLSWVLPNEGRGDGQSAYEVLVATTAANLDRNDGDAWDSGKVPSTDSIHAAYRGKQVLSGKTYYWKVRFWDHEGSLSAYSQPAQFEMGLLSREDWKGRWISGGDELRKTFRLPASPLRARVYVTALGYYALRINGRRVGQCVLDPAFTTYPKRVLYRTYDVTHDLKRGLNVVAITLGGGWATLSMPPGFKGYYSQPAALLQLNADLPGGKTVSVASDGTWRTAPGPIVSDNIYNGEVYDARLETPGWDRPGFDDSSWKRAQVVAGSSGTLSAEMMPPIRVVDEIVPERMSNPRPGVYVYDMGQNMSGWIKLRVQGPRGARVMARYAEVLYPNGMINRANLRSAKARDVYILKGGGPETFHPSFTYHGFRYVEITGFPGAPGLDSIRGEVVHTDVKDIGSFVASKPILNQIQHMIHWGQITNLFSIPTDCDQRDERQGWLGDAAATASEASMNFNMAAFYTNFIRDIHDAQSADGSLPDTVPHRWGSRPADPAWGTAYPTICWTMWRQYGDRRILEENYAGLQKYIGFLQAHAPGNLLALGRYGDWVSLVPTPISFVSAAYYYHDVDLLARIAGVLGKSADEATYNQLAGEIKDAINQKYFHPETGEYATGTQTANAVALAMGITPAKMAGSVMGNLYKNVVYYHDVHLTTGFVGTKWIMPALSAFGHPEVAYELATRTSYPSWGYMAKHGATTVWELWQEQTGPSMNSHDHPALGAVGAWFYQALAGIQQLPDSGGYQDIRIAPEITEDLHWASGSIRTPRGLVAVAWSHSPGKITLNVTIPPGSSASVVLPVEREWTDITVTEDGRIVWKDNHYIAGDPGVESASSGAGGVTFRAGSGHYGFVITGS